MPPDRMAELGRRLMRVAAGETDARESTVVMAIGLVFRITNHYLEAAVYERPAPRSLPQINIDARGAAADCLAEIEAEGDGP